MTIRLTTWDAPKPPDRAALEVGAGTAHSATVGPAGVECLEASR